MTEILTFEKAIEVADEQCSKRHLILGNGFSIACLPHIFRYESLFEQADWQGQDELKGVFEELGTHDFESVIRSLDNAAILVQIYAPEDHKAAERMRKAAVALKEILVSTIAANHPRTPGDISDEAFEACRSFLAKFLVGGHSGKVFSLNYDLLLYWAFMHENGQSAEPINLDAGDGFGNDEDDPDADYVVWQGETGAHRADVFYLHGALHLFDAGSELQKFTWVRTDRPLIEQAREAINTNRFPLFVAEGSSQKKKSKIRHNAYLYQGLKQLTANAATRTHCFFLHGHSLAENDGHILSRLGRGRFKKLFVSLYGSPTEGQTSMIIQRARALAEMREDRAPLEIAFYDAASANVWGDE